MGYSITAKNADILVDGKAGSASIPGKQITVKLNNIPEGKRFAGWQILQGDVHVEDLSAKEITFVMQGEPVKLVATYKDLILGDVNEDGQVTNADVLCIFRYIYNPVVYPVDLEVGDVTHDGEITNADVLMIFRHIFSPALYPLD